MLRYIYIYWCQLAGEAISRLVLRASRYLSFESCAYNTSIHVNSVRSLNNNLRHSNQQVNINVD